MSTRVVNKYKEPYDVYIGRGSVWGNPFTHLVGPTKAEFHVATREEAVARYRQYILERPDLLRRLPELVGKRLGCFCAPKSCHGDVLVELVNASTLLADLYCIDIDVLTVREDLP